MGFENRFDGLDMGFEILFMVLIVVLKWLWWY